MPVPIILSTTDSNSILKLGLSNKDRLFDIRLSVLVFGQLKSHITDYPVSVKTFDSLVEVQTIYGVTSVLKFSFRIRNAKIQSRMQKERQSVNPEMSFHEVRIQSMSSESMQSVFSHWVARSLLIRNFIRETPYV